MHAKKLEEERKRDMIFFTVSSWLNTNTDTYTPQNELSRDFLNEYLKTIDELVKLMGYDFNKDNLLVPTLIYADQYVSKTGPVQSIKQLFLLLLVSSLQAVKMWEDWGTDSLLVEEITGITRKQVATVEKIFLATLDYSLYLSSEQIASFQHQKYHQLQEKQQQISPSMTAQIEDFRIQ